VDPDQAEMERVLGAPYPHTGIDGSAVEPQDLLLQQNVEVGAGAKLQCDAAAGNQVDLRLPVVFEADHKAHPIGVTGPQPSQAGIRQVSQQATPLPGHVDLQMPAVMLPGRAEPG